MNYVFLIGPRHTNLRLYPDDPASVASRHNVTLLTDEAGRSYYVLGAGPENGMLVSAGMRETDLHTYPNSLAQGVKTPDGMTNDEFIGEIIENSRSFRNGSHNYDLFPEITPGEGYNSNSYVSGLLQTSGGSAEKPSGVVPGWRTPAPFGVRQ